MKINVEIITPNGLFKEAEVSMINVVSEEGQRGLLPNHMPIVVSLTTSIMNMDEDTRNYYSIDGGLLYLENNKCRILTNSIESKNEVDLDRALAAKKRAEERLGNSDFDQVRAAAALARAINRINLKNLK